MWWFGLIIVALALTACERKPEDLEKWRNAEGGFEKMVEWAQSPEEPEAVRIRAVQILIEEHQPNELQPLLEGVDDAAMRKTLVDGALQTVEKMWSKGDFPEVDKETKTGMAKVAGRLEVEGAKDAAYFLQPHAEGATRKRLEEILAEWMSEDQDVRNQLGVTTIAQIAPRAGDEGIKMMLKWVNETKQPALVVKKIMAANEDDKNEKVTAALADAIRERAEAEHPNLSNQTETAMLMVPHENLAPYAKKAILDPESPANLIDSSMDVYIKALGERATPLLAKLVTEKTGLLRWVSATRLIEIRGKAGALAAVKALPLEAEKYSDDEKHALSKESEIFCNFVDTELKEQGVESADDVVANMLSSDRWPVQVIGLQCAKITQATGVKDAVDAMTKDRTVIPNWGEEEKTIGELAEEVSASLTG